MIKGIALLGVVGLLSSCGGGGGDGLSVRSLYVGARDAESAPLVEDVCASDRFSAVRGSRSDEVDGQVQGRVRGALGQRRVQGHRHCVVGGVGHRFAGLSSPEMAKKVTLCNQRASVCTCPMCTCCVIAFSSASNASWRHDGSVISNRSNR